MSTMPSDFEIPPPTTGTVDDDDDPAAERTDENEAQGREKSEARMRNDILRAVESQCHFGGP
jgi:hypothetical protein